jgi:hypothetical protein
MVRSTARMPAVRQASCSGESTRRVVAFAMLAQWLLLLAFSSSEHLHRAVCDGAKKPSHDCAFVAVAKGQVCTSLSAVLAPAPEPAEIFACRAFSGRDPQVVDLRLMPDRGPPAVFLLT